MKQAGLALCYGFPDIPLKFERLPAALYKPGVEFGFDSGWAHLDDRAEHALMVMLHLVLRGSTWNSRFFGYLFKRGADGLANRPSARITWLPTGTCQTGRPCSE